MIRLYDSGGKEDYIHGYKFTALRLVWHLKKIEPEFFDFGVMAFPSIK